MSAISREDVVNLADLTIDLDCMAERCATGAWRDFLKRASDDLYRISRKLDVENGFGIYLEEDCNE